MPTIHDAAAAAGVSTATVSRVINNTGPVSDAVRARVEKAIAEIGYRPNALARSLRTESTGTIGLIVSNILNPFFTELARAAEDAAIDAGYTVVLGNSDERADKENLYIRQLLEKRVDGLILNPADAASNYIREVADRGVPIVLIDRSVANVNAPLVTADPAPAITDLVAHLCASGFTRPAIISGPTTLKNGRDRFDAFSQALRLKGMELSPARVAVGDFERESGYVAMTSLLEADLAPDVVFVSNGRMTLGALEAARARGVRIGPGGMGIAAYDDDPFYSLLTPSITAIAQPTTELGGAAMRTLLELIQGGEPARTHSLPARLIVRESTTTP
ncbi:MULTISPECIES: LacI family DNA-binding transcriptional regulator [Microbacterium]|uniref:LacI family DNA-binding transcriptional regulator n=1 Tax=Microbacterium TaxID=33882 RepID=UPI00146D4D13|nr:MULTISPECIES: LacI family DNA-binding transcriptional regulator [Microbacterium]